MSASCLITDTLTDHLMFTSCLITDTLTDRLMFTSCLITDAVPRLLILFRPESASLLYITQRITHALRQLYAYQSRLLKCSPK